MRYHVVVENQKGTFPIKGLNELLNGGMYNFRAKKYHNPVKAANDKACLRAIKKYLPGVQISEPIRCVFRIYAQDKKHDRGNLCAACEKSFLDALQTAQVIRNDGWEDVGDSVFCTAIDREHPRIEVEIMTVDKDAAESC